MIPHDERVLRSIAGRVLARVRPAAPGAGGVQPGGAALRRVPLRRDAAVVPDLRPGRRLHRRLGRHAHGAALSQEHPQGQAAEAAAAQGQSDAG